MTWPYQIRKEVSEGNGVLLFSDSNNTEDFLRS